MINLIEDARNEMDMMVTFVFTWLLSTAVTLYLLRDHGAWLLVAIATYGLAWGSYRASLIAAAEYGQTLMRAIDLYRFELIEQLRLKPAGSVEDEVAYNKEIMRMLAGPLTTAPTIPDLRRYTQKKDSGADSC